MSALRSVVVLLLLLPAIAVRAQTPPQISFQGVLEDPVAGGPASGDFEMTFELWDDPVAGNLISSAGPLTVSVSGGVFQVALPFGAADFDGSPRHLQVVIDGEELSPRLPVLSVPYAQIAGQATTAVTVIGGAVTEAGLADGAVTPSKLAPACAEGEVLQQSGGDWVCVPLPAGAPVCSAGDFINCFDGPPSAMGVGPCRAGMRFCTPAGDGFGSCTGDVLPQTEVCDGIDNDCDGQGEAGAIDAVPRYLDSDGDGFGDTSTEELSCDASPPYVGQGDDCDDTAPETFPGAHEVCDGVDNDCDAEVDEACTACSSPEQACIDDCSVACDGNTDCLQQCVVGCGLSIPCFQVGFALYDCGETGGCDQLQSAAELDLCLRQSCPAEYVAVFGVECSVGEMRTCGTDVGVCELGTQTCAASELYGACEGSVDPTPEVCGDGLDNDCDGEVDEEGNLYFPDQDGDGFGAGDPGLGVSACVAPPGFVADGTDCDDLDASVNPGAAEICADGIDNDCDGLEAEDREWYRDADGDGFGDPGDIVIDCVQPPGYIDQPDDCDDTDAAVNPGAAEICDGIDNDCNGLVDDGAPGQEAFTDADDDGYGDAASPQGMFCAPPPGTVLNDLDCDDFDATINPDAAEVCDGIDNDCNAAVDDGLPTQNAFEDFDEDGYGDASVPLGPLCAGLPGTAFNDLDCNDVDATINPDAAEVCDGIDNDCNGAVDDGAGQVAYRDADGDTYGDAATPLGSFCTEPPGGVFDDQDCDDTASAINPAAAEICGNGVDENCDGSADACNLADFCELAFPASVSRAVGVPFDVFVRVFEPGITDQSVLVDPDPSIVGEAGWGPAGSSPETAPGSWTWTAAAGNPGWDGGAAGVPTQDEYLASLSIPAQGTFSYAGRFSADGGSSWLYCDLDPGSADGFQPAQAGTATITP